MKTSIKIRKKTDTFNYNDWISFMWSWSRTDSMVRVVCCTEIFNRCFQSRRLPDDVCLWLINFVYIFRKYFSLKNNSKRTG